MPFLHDVLHIKLQEVLGRVISHTCGIANEAIAKISAKKVCFKPGGMMDDLADSAVDILKELSL